ncbi:MAG: NAD(P)-dependent oxidoreductase [Actinobacteria bacterium]|nr:NAD(P)-dependent oxidoreductase [Actinomycetota bacterium]
MADRIAVLGCGMMGSALARTLAGGDHEVLVWNRTPEKARELARTEGIAAVEDAAEAVLDASATILMVADYEVAAAVLERVEGSLEGRTILNFVSGSPQGAAGFEREMLARGAAYVDGTIVAYPKEIGDPLTLIACAGARVAWEAVEPLVLELGGGSRLLSESVGAANAFEAVIGSYYMVAWSGFLEGAAYADAHGLSPQELLPGIDYLTDLLRVSTHEVTEGIVAEDFSTDQATIDVFVDAVAKYRSGFEQSGFRGGMLAALAENLRRAQTGGHGGDGFHAQYLTAAEDA